MSDWGQGAVNNTINWGKAPKNDKNQGNFGAICYTSDSPQQTNLTGEPGGGGGFSNLQSILLDGVDDFCGMANGYSQLNGNMKWTISFWTKTSSAVTALPLTIGTGSNRQIFVGFYSNNRILFKKNANADGTIVRATVPNLFDGNWNHVAICVDLTLTQKRGQIYFNGTDVTAGTSLDQNPLQSSQGAFYINESNKAYAGNLDEIAIYSGTDLRNSISVLYGGGQPSDLNNNGIVSPTTWYRCGDGDTAPIIKDQNGSADLTMNNFNTFSNDVPT